MEGCPVASTRHISSECSLEDSKHVLDDLGLKRYCCRRMIVAHADLVDESYAWDKLLETLSLYPFITGLWGSLVSFQLGVLVTPIQIRADPPSLISVTSLSSSIAVVWRITI